MYVLVCFIGNRRTAGDQQFFIGERGRRETIILGVLRVLKREREEGTELVLRR